MTLALSRRAPLPRLSRFGWLMGLYQMARGEHFLTHTLTTMFLALAVISLLVRLLRLADVEKPVECYKMQHSSNPR